MSTGVSAAALWGRIALHNKLLSDQQWKECVEVFKKLGGKTPIDRIAVHKGFVQDRHAELITKKVDDILAKQGGGDIDAHAEPAAAPATRSQPHPSKPATPSAGKPAPAAPAAPAEDDEEPLEPEAEPEEAERGEIDLAGPEPQEATKGWRPSDAEWVEAEPTGSDGAKKTSHADDIESVALVGDDESDHAGATPAPAATAPGEKVKPKIIVQELTRLKIANDSPKLVAPKPIAGAPAGMGLVTAPAGEGEERMASSVAPGDVHPDALEILRKGVALGASDVHLASGSPPFYRLHGQLVFTELPKLTPELAQRYVLGFMDDKQQQRYLKHHDLDFSWEHPEMGRFRVNALEQFRGPDIIFRIVASRIPSLKELGLPDTLARLTEWHQGLVLITGPAGSGKTTTAAAMVDLINSTRQDHVITVEDPIEVIHPYKSCNVTQRQVPRDTASFASALKAALREDPDVIMIGEMRDLETVSLAIRAAETGHLVFGTLQTKSAARTIDRVIDVFPADQQAQVRTMLSESLRGIISQQLILRADGKGRVPAIELLFVNNAVANLIRDSKTFQLPSLMQTGKKVGHKLMDESLQELLAKGIITREEAIKAAENPKHFKEEPAGAKPKH